MNFLPIVPYHYRRLLPCSDIGVTLMRLHERLQLELKNRKATPQELGYTQGWVANPQNSAGFYLIPTEETTKKVASWEILELYGGLNGKTIYNQGCSNPLEVNYSHFFGWKMDQFTSLTSHLIPKRICGVGSNLEQRTLL